MLLVDFLKNNNLLTLDLKLVCIRCLSDFIIPTYVFREDFYKVSIPNVKLVCFSYSDELEMYSDGDISQDRKEIRNFAPYFGVAYDP